MWKKLNINKQNIKVDIGSSSLIAIPNSSWSMWVSNSLIRNGDYKNTLALIYKEDFTFRLVKYGKGKYNARTILESKTIGSSELEEMLESMNLNKNKFETHIPTELKVEKVEVLEELKDE